jgi:hypothetical protein
VMILRLLSPRWRQGAGREPEADVPYGPPTQPREPTGLG